jgi:hypothetical protein
VSSYRYSSSYVGVNVDREVGAGCMRQLSEPLEVFAFDLAQVTQPLTLSRAERQAALAGCEARAQPAYDPLAPDPDNIWGGLKSSLGQEAIAKGDPAFLDGEIVAAFRAYSEAAQVRARGHQNGNRPTDRQTDRLTDRLVG